MFVGEAQGGAQLSDLLWTEILLPLESVLQNLKLLLSESDAGFAFLLRAPLLLALGSRRKLLVGAGGRVRGVMSEHPRAGRPWGEI